MIFSQLENEKIVFKESSLLEKSTFVKSSMSYPFVHFNYQIQELTSISIANITIKKANLMTTRTATLYNRSSVVEHDSYQFK